AQWVKESDDGSLAARAHAVSKFERGESSSRLQVVKTPPEMIPIDVMPTAISSPSSPSSASAATVGGIAQEAPLPAPKRSAGVVIVLALAALALVGGTLGAVALFAKPRAATTQASPSPPPPTPSI